MGRLESLRHDQLVIRRELDHLPADLLLRYGSLQVIRSALLRMLEDTERLLETAVIEAGIRCPQCGMVSHNTNDIKQRYCGACHMFHSQMPARFQTGDPLDYL